MQQQRFIRAGLVLATQQHGGRGGLHRFVRRQQHGLGLGVGRLRGLGVGGQNGQDFGFNFGEIRLGEFSAHVSHYSTPSGGDGEHRSNPAG